MRVKRIIFVLIPIALIAALVSTASADDGEMFRRNISKTPDAETEKAAIYMMDFYVPAQRSTGEVAPVDNYTLTLTTTAAYEPRDYAKPLVSVWIDDLGGAEVPPDDEVDEVSIMGGMSFGQFDAFVGVSLDDGTSWRRENASRSAHLSSFTLANGHPYPGDVHNVVHQVAEDKILLVWASKYCQSGFPLYSLNLDPEAQDNDGEYFKDLEDTWGKNALYLYDFFGVAGTQASVNYTEQGFPEVGEVPYSCIWTQRGKLLPGDDPMTADYQEASHVVWTAPERLTAGVRDANLPAVDCAGGAGCALTWQEDPAGLRPGQGLGPGEGWSGAIVNAKTDIWYSYISFADFDYVVNDMDADGMADPGEAMLIEEYEALKIQNEEMMERPKPYVPMAMPVRLTDNDMCRATPSMGDAVREPEDPYCWTDFDSIDDLDHTNIVSFFDNLIEPETDADFCATTVEWTNPNNVTLPICVTEDGRWMNGRVGASRVRMAIKPYSPTEAVDLDGDGVVEKSAWLSLGAEETKALGITRDPDEDGVDDFDPVDIGKDMFYYSFDFAKPYNLHVNAALDAEDESPYIVQQGGMLNQPAQCSDWFPLSGSEHPDAICDGHGEFFDPLFDPITGYEYYLTEISRRFSIALNNPANIIDTEINKSGLAGMLIYKQGVIWQGGPADIMLRRLVIPETFDSTKDNPFAFENMECTNPDGTSGWVYPTDSTGTYAANPNYLKGLCMAPGINLSGTTIKECTTASGSTASGNDACAEGFPVSEDGSINIDITTFPKVLEWRQCDGLSTTVGGMEGCEEDNDLDDQSWENPFDVAKGHRGFLYGDMVMMMYAWSPNWQSNAVGNDHYNLYQRRSFDGGLTWTTTPDDWCGPTDGLCGAGLSALEYNYGATIGEFVPIVYEYEAGDFEQARNLSLLHGNKITILDPRYSPPGGLKQYPTIRTDWLEANADLLPSDLPEDDLPYTDDAAIDPSKYYMVYETGDNSTVAEGEAIPLNLYYSRATVFGDIYEWFDYANDSLDCLQSDPVTGICLDPVVTVEVEPRWPWLENAADDLSGEASVVMNPGGTFVYNVWNQWKEDITVDEYGVEHEEIYDSDIWFRRLMWLPDDTTISIAIAEILYQSTDRADYEDEDIVLVASGRTIGNQEGAEIVNYRWWVDDDTGQYFNERTWKFPPRGLIPGWRTFNVQVQNQAQAENNPEQWSQPKSTKIWIAEKFYDVYMPMTIRN